MYKISDLYLLRFFEVLGFKLKNKKNLRNGLFAISPIGPIQTNFFVDIHIDLGYRLKVNYVHPYIQSTTVLCDIT